tara:strand:- start:8911 stop:9426 length:516 start_codon:yes stop_codon:yes gene_type:complete
MKDNYDLSNLRKKPKRKNSRAKGNTFELKIATAFNERFKTKDFNRSPGSGAYATTHSLPEHLKIYGDLITPLNFKFCIECKKGYPKENLYSIFNHSSEFWGFVDQCEKDSGKAGRIPMVIFKQDRRPTLCIVPTEVDFGVTEYFEIHRGHTYYKVYLFDEALTSWDSNWFA